MKKFTASVLAIVAFAAGLYVFNASWRVAPEVGGPKLIAHRGVHQTYHRQGLERDTCTAQRIDPPTHDFIENTIPSMRAAFAAGADVVELDVHPTTDGYFAVMHDWTIDCRTEGTGKTRSHSLAYLKSLDLGYGYTADGGSSFPLRGKGVGMMPSLNEVFEVFTDKHFLINFKSNDASEGDMLAALLQEHPEWRQGVWGVYGGDGPTWRAAELIGGGLFAASKTRAKSCLKQYMMLGWSGYMPSACKNTGIHIPIDKAGMLWGWPHLLVKRFNDAGSEVAVFGPMDGNGAPGIDTLEQLGRIPENFSGYIWTDKIEIIGPAVRK